MSPAGFTQNFNLRTYVQSIALTQVTDLYLLEQSNWKYIFLLSDHQKCRFMSCFSQFLTGGTVLLLRFLFCFRLILFFLILLVFLKSNERSLLSYQQNGLFVFTPKHPERATPRIFILRL